MSTPFLAIPLLLAFLFAFSSALLQAQRFDPDAEGSCLVPPMNFGTAVSYYANAQAFPNGDPRRLANKRCFSQALDLSDQNTMESTGTGSSASATYSYHVGRGRLNLLEEVKTTGHQTGPSHSPGSGSASAFINLWWVDLFTLNSSTTKPVSKVKDAVIDPAQIVVVKLTLLNDGQNQCSGDGRDNFYRTNVLLLAEGYNKQTIGGQQNTGVSSGCQDQLDTGTIQALLGIGHFRVELMVQGLVVSTAMHGDGYVESNSAKANLGEYHFCMQVVKGPADLKITSASGIDYTCPKNIPGMTHSIHK